MERSMIHVILSDFTSDQLKRLRKAREEAAEVALAPYREAERSRLVDVEAQHREYHEAWSARRYLRALVLWVKILFTAGPKPVPAVAVSPISDAEHILQSGDAGQRLVIDRLAAQLDDRWIALSGYMNRRGEIDVVLIGPDGIACVEVKAMNAQLTIDGDYWVRRRIGRSGDVLDGPSAVVDKGGRSPSRQLNEPTEHLSQWLQRYGFGTTIQRWVVLAHANSTLADVRDLTVDAVVHVTQLNAPELLARKKIALTANDLARLRDLIERDHWHHAALRSRSATSWQRIANAPKQDALPEGQGHPRTPQPSHRPGDLPVNSWRPPTAESLHERRLLVLADMCRRIAAGTAGEDQRPKLLSAVVHDLLIRDQPSETPDLLAKLRREPATEVVQQMIDKAMQVFEFDDRCLVGLVVPVAVRYRSFGKDILTRGLANKGAIGALGPVVARILSARQVVFDRRLYEQSNLADLSARQWRDYLLGLETHATEAAAATTPMTIGLHNADQWVVVCITGVAVFEPGVGAAMRELDRLRLSPVIESFFEMAMIEFDPRRQTPASIEEASSWGLWTVPQGLRAAATARHRIAMGLQGQATAFSTPGRDLAPPRPIAPR